MPELVARYDAFLPLSYMFRSRFTQWALCYILFQTLLSESDTVCIHPHSPSLLLPVPRGTAESEGVHVALCHLLPAVVKRRLRLWQSQAQSPLDSILPPSYDVIWSQLSRVVAPKSEVWMTPPPRGGKNTTSSSQISILLPRSCPWLSLR